MPHLLVGRGPVADPDQDSSFPGLQVRRRLVEVIFARGADAVAAVGVEVSVAVKFQDLVLAEYLATLVGIEILHDRSHQIEELARERLVVNMAMKALSYSEIDAINHIITRLKEMSAEKNAGARKEGGECEGVVIASKIADQVGVTRSVIVNALRKLESAGIIESRSLGMKGTFIKVLSPMFVEELSSKFKRAD